MRVGVTGASGFVGRALVGALVARGDAVRAFSRRASADVGPPGVQLVQLDLVGESDVHAIARALEGLDAVIHLAGESVAGRWTANKKRLIADSRSLSTRNLVAGMRACLAPPRTFVSASASGYYGSRSGEPLTESSPPGDDFLARVCLDWEREATIAEAIGVRTVCLRQGIVFGAGGGALGAMLPPFRAGAGGPLGSGAQWWPWIHIDDDVALILLALDRDDCRGPINAVSPDVATNARVSQALGHALRRPSLAFAPPIALRALLGEFAQTLLASQLMLPAEAEDLGFVWRHEQLERALLDILDPGSDRADGLVRFTAEETVEVELARVFEFFSNAANLEALTPPMLDFHMRTAQPVAMRRGAAMEYSLKVRGFPLRWKTLIARWQPPRRFVDYQLKGPYQLWRHQHDFEEVSGGVRVRDTIDYSLPLAPLSAWALPMVSADVRRIFDYRRSRLRELLLATGRLS